MSSFHDIAIGELLPQQPPFRFVDHIELYSEGETRVSFTPGNGNLLMEDGCLSAAGVMEHMAQSCASRVGYLSYLRHIPPRIGFITQIKAWELSRFPKSGELLETDIIVQYETMGITLADVTVRSAGELIAQGQFKTFLKEDD